MPDYKQEPSRIFFLVWVDLAGAQASKELWLKRFQFKRIVVEGTVLFLVFQHQTRLLPLLQSSRQASKSTNAKRQNLIVIFTPNHFKTTSANCSLDSYLSTSSGDLQGGLTRVLLRPGSSIGCPKICLESQHSRHTSVDQSQTYNAHPTKRHKTGNEGLSQHCLFEAMK